MKLFYHKKSQKPLILVLSVINIGGICQILSQAERKVPCSGLACDKNWKIFADFITS